ncbi:MAG: carboxylesterase family protein, partial [Gammaproteobacteria bacterium]|nr:carboxylesterase family protein [Gammaproteobacteria bacterium]
MVKTYPAARTSILLVIVFMLAVACTRPDQAPVVTIDSGKLLGVRHDDVTAFKGIPFAASTGGDNRWHPPQPVAAWNGIRAAENYGPFCPQYRSQLLWFELGEMSEDCLTLNVWIPDHARGEKLPVMVWIHGGGFVQGSGNIPRLNSPDLAREGIILVTLNYRLTLFGFFAHPAMTMQ